MIGDLHMGFVRMALYASTIAAFRMLTAPAWGRALDRVGARPVLVACAFALSLSPLLWILAAEGRLWPLAIDAALCGVGTAGISLATFSLPIALSQPRERSFYVGTLAGAGGVATGIASALGGALAHVLPAAWSLLGQPLHASHALFLAGAVARFFAAFLALRILDRPLARVLRMPMREPLERAKLSA